MDKIHAPALVRALRLRGGPSMQAHALATTHAHAYLKAFQPIPTMDTLLVHQPALTTEHHVDTQVPEARSGMCDLPDPQAQCRLISGFALAIPTSVRELGEPNRLTHTHRVTLPNPLGQRATARWPQSFFRTTSPRMCLSRVRSATRRLRRAFSSRSWRSSRISVSPSFAYFFFQR